jgi:hypothetical protein
VAPQKDHALVASFCPPPTLTLHFRCVREQMVGGLTGSIIYGFDINFNGGRR